MTPSTPLSLMHSFPERLQHARENASLSALSSPCVRCPACGHHFAAALRRRCLTERLARLRRAAEDQTASMMMEFEERAKVRAGGGVGTGKGKMGGGGRGERPGSWREQLAYRGLCARVPPACSVRRAQVLERLGYIDSEHIVQLKGRAACEVEPTHALPSSSSRRHTSPQFVSHGARTPCRSVRGRFVTPMFTRYCSCLSLSYPSSLFPPHSSLIYLLPSRLPSAAQLGTVENLLLTEAIFANLLAPLSLAETVAVLSALLCQEKPPAEGAAPTGPRGVASTAQQSERPRMQAALTPRLKEVNFAWRGENDSVANLKQWPCNRDTLPFPPPLPSLVLLLCSPLPALPLLRRPDRRRVDQAGAQRGPCAHELRHPDHARLLRRGDAQFQPHARHLRVGHREGTHTCPTALSFRPLHPSPARSPCTSSGTQTTRRGRM